MRVRPSNMRCHMEPLGTSEKQSIAIRSVTPSQA